MVKQLFRSLYYTIYGSKGKSITINDESYVVSAHVARGIKSTIDETPLKLLLKFVQSRSIDVLFDIGANIGVVSVILSKKMKPNSKIYAFEPAPLSFDYLKDTARVQKGHAQVIPVNKAVSSAEGKLYFTNDGNSCTNHISTEMGQSTVEVDAITIDSYCAVNKVVPQLMKIDVEGAEFWALEGMKQVLKDNNIIVLVEIHYDFLTANNIGGANFKSLVDEIGYHVYDEKGKKIASQEIINNACVILSKEHLSEAAFK